MVPFLRAKSQNVIQFEPKHHRYNLNHQKQFQFLMKESTIQSMSNCLIFCNKNVEIVRIPDFILHIGPYAFYSSNNLKKI